MHIPVYINKYTCKSSHSLVFHSDLIKHILKYICDYLFEVISLIIIDLRINWNNPHAFKFNSCCRCWY